MWKYLCKTYFYYRGIYWYKNLINIPKFIKGFFFIMKNGYPYWAVYDNFSWFIEIQRNIIKDMIKNLSGYPAEFEKYNTEEEPDMGFYLWKETLLGMIDYLDKMDENNPIYESMEYKNKNQCMKEAKNDFFELYSTYFYSMWD